jgi:UDP-glucuronate 4-epimerase
MDSLKNADLIGNGLTNRGTASAARATARERASAMLQGKKLLVTGITGNLGGSIAHALAPHNEAWGFARFGRAGQREYWERNGIRTVVGDCADGTFEGLPDDFDYVIHCAAATGPASFDEGMRGNPVASGLLMAHCQRVNAFLHISTAGVYSEHADPNHLYHEDDLTGSSIIGHYEGTKLAAEGAVHAMSCYLGLPTIICRLGVQYGAFHQGGLLGMILSMILAGQTVPLPAKRSGIIRPISDADVVDFLEPLLGAASVPPVTVNLAGDEDINLREVIEIFGQLAGVTPHFELSDAIDYPNIRVDNTERLSITGPCRVPVLEGLVKMYEDIRSRAAV